jgi:hypothetical protein
MGGTAFSFETLLLRAKAKLQRIGRQEALGSMDEALRLAHAGGYYQTVVDEGPRIAELLRAGFEAGAWADPALRGYAERVLAAIEASMIS